MGLQFDLVMDHIHKLKDIFLSILCDERKGESLEPTIHNRLDLSLKNEF